jgi:hypothetical protein
MLYFNCLLHLPTNPKNFLFLGEKYPKLVTLFLALYLEISPGQSWLMIKLFILCWRIYRTVRNFNVTMRNVPVLVNDEYHAMNDTSDPIPVRVLFKF